MGSAKAFEGKPSMSRAKLGSTPMLADEHARIEETMR
jgi:hypothetical protein